MTIVWWGNFSYNDGYANASKEYVRGLKRIGHDVIIRGDVGKAPDDLIENRDRPDPTPGTYTFVIHTLPWITTMDGAIGRYTKDATSTVYMTVWEADEIPYQWLDPLSRVDAVIVPSTFCYDAFRRTFDKYGLNKRIEIIPHIVREIPVKQFSYKFNSHEVSILGLASGAGYRKGFDLLLKSFVHEFSPDERVNLYVKTFDADIKARYKSIIDEGRNKWKAEPKVTSIRGNYTDEQIRHLYFQCDVFTMLSRGEGFCVPLAEAAKEGRRVVYPAGSLSLGNVRSNLWADDFLVPDNISGYGVESAWDSVDGSEFSFDPILKNFEVDRMKWVTILFDSARSQLRAAVNDARSLGKDVIHPKIELLSSERVTKELSQLLENLI